MTMKPPMSTAPNKLSGSFWSPPAFAYVYLLRADLLQVVVYTIFYGLWMYATCLYVFETQGMAYLFHAAQF